MVSVHWTKSHAWKAFGVCANLNSALGLWPLHKDNFFLKIRCFVSIFELALMVICSVYELLITCGYAEYGVDTLVVISFGIIGLAKLIFYYVHRDKLRFNVESAIKDWSSIKTSDINSIMHGRRKIHERLTIIYLVTGTSVAIMYPLKNYFFDRDSFVKIAIKNDYDVENTTTVLKKRFLFPSFCLLNNVSQTLYLTIIINQFVQFVISVAGNFAGDIFFITITHHLCGQFHILKERFASFEETKSVTETRRQFVVLIARHRHLLKLAKYLEASFNMVLFTQMLVNVMVINVTGFNFLKFLKKGEQYGAVTNFGILIFTLVQTFVYAYMGDNITSEVEGIRESIFAGPWRTMPKSMSKDIIFLMIRSNTSFYLTAGKFFKMTRSTFTNVVKTSASYLSVFYALTKD